MDILQIEIRHGQSWAEQLSVKEYRVTEEYCSKSALAL